MLGLLILFLLPLINAAIVNVEVSNNKFTPKDVIVNIGDTVTWVWVDDKHNVISGSGCVADDKFCSPGNKDCSIAPVSNKGSTYYYMFNTAGQFPYFDKPSCTKGMVGSVSVVGPTTSTSGSLTTGSLTTGSLTTGTLTTTTTGNATTHNTTTTTTGAASITFSYYTTALAVLVVLLLIN